MRHALAAADAGTPVLERTASWVKSIRVAAVKLGNDQKTVMKRGARKVRRLHGGRGRPGPNPGSRRIDEGGRAEPAGGDLT